MSLPIVPPSLNLAETKETIDSGCQARYTRHTASSSAYEPGSTVVIEIPTGGANRWLMPQESYLSFSITPSYTDTTANLRLDGSAHSFIRALRVYHGDELINIQEYGQLANFILDMMNDTSDKVAMGTANGLSADGHTGEELAKDVKRTFAIPLFCPLIGVFGDHSLPLSWMGAASLRVEIDLALETRAFTTAGDLVTNGTSNSAALGDLTYVATEISYFAKNCAVSADVNNGLVNAHAGNIISIPTFSYRYESASIASGSSAFNAKASFQHSSLNAIFFWLQEQTIATGSVTSNLLGHASSSRYLPRLSSWYISIGGDTVPSYSVNGKVHTFMELMRCFNKTSSSSQLAIPSTASYTTDIDTRATQLVTCGKAAAGFDLENGDSDDVIFAGRDTRNDHVAVVGELSGALAAAHILHMYARFDVMYSLQDGSLRKSQ